MAAVAVLGAFCTFDAFTRTASDDTVYRMRFALVFVSCILLTALAIMVWRFLSRLSSARVKLTESRFEYSDARTGANLRYGEIGVVKAAGGPYFGGWLTVHGSGQRVPIYLELEDISGFVLELKERLDGKHRQDAYRERELYGFLQWAKFTEVMLRVVRKESLSLAVASYVAGFLAYLTASVNGSNNPVWFLLGALYPWLLTVLYALIVRQLVGKASRRREFTVYEPDPIKLTRSWHAIKKWGLVVFLFWIAMRSLL